MNIYVFTFILLNYLPRSNRNIFSTYQIITAGQSYQSSLQRFSSVSPSRVTGSCRLWAVGNLYACISLSSVLCPYLVTGTSCPGRCPWLPATSKITAKYWVMYEDFTWCCGNTRRALSEFHVRWYVASLGIYCVRYLCWLWLKARRIFP